MSDELIFVFVSSTAVLWSWGVRFTIKTMKKLGLEADERARIAN